MQSPSAIDRLRAGFQARGFNYLVEAALNRIPRKLFYFDYYLLVVADTCDIPVRNQTGYETRMLTAEDLTTITGFTFPIEMARRELREGSACVAVLKGDKAVAWRWGATGSLYIDYCNTVVETGNDGFYTYRLETIPEERYKGHVNSCLKTMYEYFAALNRRLNYSLISKRNRHNLKMHERCGFHSVGEITVLTLLGSRWCFYTKWPFHNKRVSLTFGAPPADMRLL